MWVNWLIVFVSFVVVVVFALWNKINNTNWKEIRMLEQNRTMYENGSNWIVDMDWINDWYYFTGVKCTSWIEICFENNLNLFYNSSWDLKTKQVVYFLNDTWSFEFTGKWYKNWDNIKDLNAKIFRWVYIPPTDHLGILAWIKELNVLLNSHNNLKDKFYFSPLWFK